MAKQHNEDMVEEAREEEREAEGEGEKRRRGGAHRRKHGGILPLDGAKEHKTHAIDKHHRGRKHGGFVPGKKSEMRPDRRARGGATSDTSPFTAAGRMSTPSYEHKGGHSRD